MLLHGNLANNTLEAQCTTKYRNTRSCRSIHIKVSISMTQKVLSTDTCAFVLFLCKTSTRADETMKEYDIKDCKTVHWSYIYPINNSDSI